MSSDEISSCLQRVRYEIYKEQSSIIDIQQKIIIDLMTLIYSNVDLVEAGYPDEEGQNSILKNVNRRLHRLSKLQGELDDIYGYRDYGPDDV